MKQLNTRYNFDEDINRRAVPALKVHPMVLGTKSEGLFAAGVADMDALQTRLDHGVFGYEAVRDGLIPALTGWLSTRHDWHIEDSSVLRAPNVLNSLAIATSLFSERGDGVIVQPPVFFDFYDIIRENHRSVVENPLIYKDGHYEIDFDDLEQRASFSRSKILFLCNPHNPIGRVWTKAELLRIGEICNQHNVLVVSDEIHGDITYLDHKYIPFGTLGSDYSNNSISLISPAKSFNIASCCCSFTIIADDIKRNRFQSENSRLTVNKNNAFANVAMEA
ncbi:MAG: aminotransferase class I/II-fold pyridoxal phosphate-dependent enzyme, partial [Gammaproteobacteria bacterium]